MGLIDAIGAASIMPFLSLLGNPKVIESSRFLQILKNFSNIESHQEFTFFCWDIRLHASCSLFVSKDNNIMLKLGLAV